MKNRIFAIVSLILFLFLLIDLLVIRKFEEFSIIAYVIIIIIFLLFFNKKSEMKNENDLEKEYQMSKKYLFELNGIEIAIPAKYIENKDSKNIIALCNDINLTSNIDLEPELVILFSETIENSTYDTILYSKMFSDTESMIKYLEEKYKNDFNIIVIGDNQNEK